MKSRRFLIGILLSVMGFLNMTNQGCLPAFGESLPSDPLPEIDISFSENPVTAAGDLISSVVDFFSTAGDFLKPADLAGSAPVSYTSDSDTASIIGSAPVSYASDLDEASDPDQAVSRTVMLYMVGSDLESRYSLGTRDIEEMIGSGLDFDRVNVMIAAGGTTSWSSLGLTNGQMQCFRMTNEGGGRGLMFMDELTTRNMADPATLEYFLSLSQKSCPAERYDLILWNHGGGPLGGYGYDSASGNVMSVSGISAALSGAGFGPAHHLEMIGFDACLMGTVEIAAMLSPYADYMVSSEETIAGTGWDYGFLGRPEIYTGNTKGILKNICDTFEKATAAIRNEDYTLSAIRLDRLEAVGKAMDNLFYREAEFTVPQDITALAACLNHCCAFGRFNTDSSYDLFDLQDFSEKAARLLPKTSLPLKQAVEDCVVYHVTNMPGAFGLSFYFPMETQNYLNTYLQFYSQSLSGLSFAPGYPLFLKSCFQSGSWSGNGSLSLPVLQGSVTPGAPLYSMQLTREQHAAFMQGRYYILIPWGDEPDAYGLIELSKDLTLTADGLFQASRERKFHYMRGSEDKSWCPVPVYECDRRENVTRFQMVMFFQRMPPDNLAAWMVFSGNLQLEMSADNPDGTLLRMVPKSDVNVAPRALVEIEPGDILSSTVVVKRKTYGADGKLLPFHEWPDLNPNGTQGYEFTVGATGLESAYLSDDRNKDYYLQLIAVDINGNCTASDMFPMQ